MKKLNELTIKEAIEKLKSGEITSVDLTKACLDQIEKMDKDIHAFLSVLNDEAVTSAQESDNRRSEGKELSEIDGVVIAINDNMCMRGTKTTAGSKMLENFVAPYDATVIKKLKDAGAVIIGKTNLDEFAMGSSTENSAFGVTKNPSDTSRVAGGSSGGSAAAVAANMCIAALGSDTGGSIREPASFCGVVGFKPTYGTVSRYGLMAMASSLDQIGPFAKTTEDAEILYNIICGHDEKDSTSINFQFPISNFQTNSNFQFSNMTIGVPKEYFAEGLDKSVKEKIQAAISEFEKMGAKTKEISLETSAHALSCYYIIMPTEVASNMGRYDGIKYGYSAEADNLLDTYINSRSEGLGAEVKRRIILGTYTSSAGYIDQYYAKAQKVRALIKQDFEKAFSEVDFIMGPVAPTTAFKIGEKSSDPLSMYLSDIYTIAVNLAGLPAISMPAGYVDGLPFGLHIIGPQMADYKLLKLAEEFEKNQGQK